MISCSVCRLHYSTTLCRVLTTTFLCYHVRCFCVPFSVCHRSVFMLLLSCSVCHLSHVLTFLLLLRARVYRVLLPVALCVHVVFCLVILCALFTDIVCCVVCRVLFCLCACSRPCCVMCSALLLLRASGVYVVVDHVTVVCCILFGAALCTHVACC